MYDEAAGNPPYLRILKICYKRLLKVYKPVNGFLNARKENSLTRVVRKTSKEG